MDGLSSVASAFAVISLAGQVVTGVQNLYQVWSTFHDAPEHVRAISEDLRLLVTVLRGIEDNERRFGRDIIMTEVLQKCRTQVDAISTITEDLSLRSGTGRSSRRAWVAIKASFQQDKITRIQDILRDLKVTLSLAQHNAHFARLSLQHNFGFSRLSHQLSTLAAHVAQPQPPIILIHHMPSTQPDTELQSSPFTSQLPHTFSREPNPILDAGMRQGMNSALREELGIRRQTKPNRGSTVYSYGSSSRVHNLFGTFSISSEARQTVESLRKTPDQIEDQDVVHSTSIRIRPATWLVRLGIRYGVDYAFEHNAHAWKHTLTTFRPVPSDALIFSACKEGDISLVGELLANGDASVWDCNDTGWTPLHFAARGCHPDLCHFLIDKGANKTKLDEEENSPLYVAIMIDDRERSTNRTAQIDTLRVFLDDLEFDPDPSQGNDGWLALSYCGIYNSFDCTVLEWLLHISIPAMAEYFEVAGFVDLINRLLDTDLMFLWPEIPNGDDRMIRALNLCQTLTGWLTVHQSILAFRTTRDYNTAELLARGTSPHSVCRLPLVKKGFTPTALAILSSTMFCRWRENLVLADVQVEDLVKREVAVGSIRDQGWSRESLIYLFELNLAPSDSLSTVCDRCNTVIDERSPMGEAPELAVLVEVAWCLELEDIKRVESGPIDDNRSSEASDEHSHETKGICCPCVQNYEFVCLLCWDALHSHDHNHGNISRSETAPEVEILLDEESDPVDWEDSMFLLSI